MDSLTRIPPDDVAALQKMHGGKLPAPQRLASPAVIVVDMVEAFVRDEYPTGWSATGEPCTREIARIIAAARSQGIPVLYTVSEHYDNDALVGEWARGARGKAVPPFCHAAPAHAIVEELAPRETEIVLPKAKPSAFFGTQLVSVLHALSCHSLIVTGMTTSGCIRATVVDAFNLNLHSVVPVSAVADRSALSHDVNLFDMGAKYADVVTTDSVIAELNAGAWRS